MKLVTALAACVIAFAVAAPAAAQQTTTPTLYKRLGGYDAIAAVTDDFVGRLASDPGLSRFFIGHSTDSLKRIRQLSAHWLTHRHGSATVAVTAGSPPLTLA